MGRFLKPDCKMSRRICCDINLKSNVREISTKCNIKTFPGQHGIKRKKTNSDYSTQLTAKQTIKYSYGLLDKQFKRFYKNACKKKGSKGESLLILLESRLDNIVYRMGFASTRAESRQLVSHKAIIVSRNGKENIINIPSFITKIGDIIKIKEKSKHQVRIQYALKCVEKTGFAKWIDVNTKTLSGTILRYPERKELSNDFKEQFVSEYYSR